MSNEKIIIVRNNDTDWNNANFLTINLNTEILDLSNFKATFTLCGVTKEFDDITNGKIKVNFTREETKHFLTTCYGVLNLIDKTGKVATIESLIPFKVISTVHNNAIATEPYTLNFDVKQGGETILTVNVESAVSVEVGMTTTLPVGSNATVTNVGTDNHLVLDFGIPQGVQGEQGIQGEKGEKGEKGDDGIDGQDGEPAKINGVNSLTINAIDGITLTQIGNTATISGSDLQNSIGNGTITINQGGILKGTFTTNQKGDTIINLDAGGSGGDAVDSVNGKTGVVVLTASDVGALPDTTTIEDLTTTAQLNALNSGATVTNIGQITTNKNAISLINNTLATHGDIVTHNVSEFATAAQGAKADTALQSINSTMVVNALGYTPYNSTNPNGYITANALNGYATQTWVGQQGYITSSVNNLANYYTKTEIDNTIGDIETALHNINSGV